MLWKNLWDYVSLIWASVGASKFASPAYTVHPNIERLLRRHLWTEAESVHSSEEWKAISKEKVTGIEHWNGLSLLENHINSWTKHCIALCLFVCEYFTNEEWKSLRDILHLVSHKSELVKGNLYFQTALTLFWYFRTFLLWRKKGNKHNQLQKERIHVYWK